MARLTFPIQQNELKLAAVINLYGPALAKLRAAGQPLPAPVWAKGIVDTGSSITCVTAAIVQKLGITEIAKTQTQTAGGPVTVRLYEVSLSIPPAGNLPGPLLTRSDLIVMELIDPPPDVEVLIGLDILLDCQLFLDGPGRQFTLDF
jgi:hypothetical protein